MVKRATNIGRKMVPVTFFMVMVFLGLTGIGSAVGTSEPEQKVEYKEVTGEVSAVSKRGIAVEYSRTRTGSSEMFLPFADHVKLQRVQDLTQLQPGDTVKVRFEQTYTEDKDGERTVLKTTATEVEMMRRAPGDGALISTEQPTGSNRQNE